MSWNKTVHDFGMIKTGERVFFRFIYNGDKDIKKVAPGCGCTTATNMNNAIQVDYIPVKPKYKKTQEISKNIKVTFGDDTTQILTINLIAI